MLKFFTPHQFNVNDQSNNTSSNFDGLDPDNDQTSFDTVNQIDPYPLRSFPIAYGAKMSGLADFSWGARFASSNRLATVDPASLSASSSSKAPQSAIPAPASATSGSLSGDFEALASTGFASSSSSSSQVVSTSGSGLVFNNTYNASCTAAFEACIVSAEDELESLFTNSVTLNVTFQEQNQGNNHVALGNSWPSSYNVSYATLKADLPSTDYLPATDPNPAGGNDWNVPEAYGRMLGIGTSTPSTDDTVTLNSYYGWDFGQDVINGLMHEISEGGMGRVGSLGGQSGTNNWSTMDLFRYTASATPDYTNGRDGVTTYFYNGIQNGVSTLSNQDMPNKGAPTLSFHNNFNTSNTFSKGDSDDWDQTQVFGSTNTGETLTLDQTELDVMQALGWNLSLTQDVDTITGSWETPTSWSTGSMPIEPQDAYVNGVTAALTSNVTVNSIATSSSALLLIGDDGGVLTPTTLIAVEGTDLNTEDSSSVASGNLGDTFVYTGSTLQIGKVDQTFDNANTLGVGKGAGSGGSGSGTGDLNIAGTINLTGRGTVFLGYSGTAGDILNAPDGNGGTVNGDLVNVDNTIETQSGSTGLINLGLGFDNQASGKVESFSFLQIIAPSLTNEGEMIAEASSTLDLSDGGAGGATFTNSGTMLADANATLDLGGDGVTETLANTGTIEILGGANLAISGNLSVTGSGAIALKGAGAAIASDGFLGTTFTNDSTIDVLVSGQIGDSDLTFVNNGTTGANGSGVTATINTGGNTVTNGSNGVLEAVNSATLAIVSNATNQGVIDAGSSPSSSFGATTGTVDLGQDGGTGSMNNTGAVAIYAGSDLAISGNYTIAGAGTGHFKGAGADITSDGSAPATFTNASASTIEALASGQIGDVGVKASNDLTFDNSGTAGPSGSGVTLTINTGSNTVLNTGTLVAANDATLAIVSDLNNEDTLSAGTSSSSSQGATTGTVDLGQDGGTRSTTNSGTIDIWGGSDLAISGKYTVTGSGYIGLKGAGADITSDGKAAATFTNASTIDAFASGQIGDEGIEASNDLTFDNTGSVIAAGSGVTLTLNTGSHTINDGGGLLEAESGATLTIDSNVDTGQPSSGSPPGGTIEAGSGGTVVLGTIVQDGVVGPSVTGQVKIAGGTFEMLSGSSVNVPIEFTAGGTLELLGIASVSISGSNGAITAVSGDVIALTNGTGDTITGTGFTVNASSGTGVTVGGNGEFGPLDIVNGSSVTVGVQANSHVDVVGSNDTVTMAPGTASVLVLNGSTDAVSAASGDIVNLKSGTGDTITGTGFTVNASSGTGVTVGGNGEFGPLDIVNGSSVTVGVQANAHVNVVGSNDTVTMAAGTASVLVLNGSTDAVSAASGDIVNLKSGTGDTITGTNVTVAMTAAAGSVLVLNGSTDAVSAASGDIVNLKSGTGDTITGTNVTVNASSGTGVTAGGNGELGPLDVVNGSSVTVGVQANAHVDVVGSNDTVTMATGAASVLVLNGSTDAVSAASGDIVNLKSGTGDTITGTGFTVSASSGTGVTVGNNGEFGPLDVVNGSSVTVGVQANSHANVVGSNDTVTMTPGTASVLVLNGSTDAVSADSGDIVNLKSGTGDTITGTNITVNGSSGVGFKIVGTADIVYAGLNDSITDGGSGSLFKITGSVGALNVSSFGADTASGVFDLLGGEGGYATAGAAYAALTSDGSGGSLLSFGAAGSLDIAGVAKSSLSAANFKIG